MKKKRKKERKKERKEKPSSEQLAI